MGGPALTGDISQAGRGQGHVGHVGRCASGCPSSETDLEVSRQWPRGGLVGGQFDRLDVGAARPLAEAGQELVEAVGRAGGLELDAAVPQVANPAAQAEGGGGALREGAEADALDPAADDAVDEPEMGWGFGAYLGVVGIRRGF